MKWFKGVFAVIFCLLICFFSTFRITASAETDENRGYWKLTKTYTATDVIDPDYLFSVIPFDVNGLAASYSGSETEAICHIERTGYPQECDLKERYQYDLSVSLDARAYIDAPAQQYKSGETATFKMSVYAESYDHSKAWHERFPGGGREIASVIGTDETSSTRVSTGINIIPEHTAEVIPCDDPENKEYYRKYNKWGDESRQLHVSSSNYYYYVIFNWFSSSQGEYLEDDGHTHTRERDKVYLTNHTYYKSAEKSAQIKIPEHYEGLYDEPEQNVFTLITARSINMTGGHSYYSDYQDELWGSLYPNFNLIYYTFYEYEWQPDTNPPAAAVEETDADTPAEIETTVAAIDEAGEDEGISIPDIILRGGGAVLGGAAIGGAVAAAAKKKKRNDNKSKSSFKMIVYKDFGDTLFPGDRRTVSAQIVEIENGVQKPNPYLTANIRISAGNDAAEVQPIGMQGQWQSANVTLKGDTTLDNAVVSFTFSGAGGTFTENVVFQTDQPVIVFGQENLGVPANKNEEFRVPFGVCGMSDNARVTCAFKMLGVADAGNKELKNQGSALSVKIVPDKEHPRVYEAVVNETASSEYPAGTTEAYQLTVIAEDGAPGSPGYRKITQDFPVFRIHLGLVLLVSTQSVGCYLQLRPERVGVEHPKASDYEYCVTEGSLLLLDYDKESQTILRIAPVPKLPDAKTGDPGSTKVYAKKLLADRYAHKSEATKDHQTLVDKLGIVAFPTADIFNTGGRKIKICSTKGGLDAPTRMNAEIEITVEHNGKKYSAKREVLLRSQPFIDFNKVDSYAFNKRQNEIKDSLERIREKIFDRYMANLYSLHDLIDRMLDGYDKRFGFDDNQVKNVMKVWTGFLEGSHKGAGGEPEGVTLADELAACYSLMQGMRDNSILGRMALGIATAGYSEVLFTAMTVADEIKEQIYTTRPGEKEMDFWDAVSIGVREYGKQYVIQASLMATGVSANYLLKNTTGVDALAIASRCSQKCTEFINRADQALCKSSKLYKAGADALKGTQNYFNTLARNAKNAVDKVTSALRQSAAKAPTTAAEIKTTLTPKDLKAIEEADVAMHSGLMKVKKLKKAQQKLANSFGPEKELARKEYEKMVREVWNDKNALKQLQRSNDPYAMNMRAEYNRYRSRVLEEARMDTLDDIAKETGIPREDLYSFNASANSGKLPTNSIPNDSDESFMAMVRSDRSKDFTVDQNIAQNAMARNFYKRMMGKEPGSIQEARQFMEDYDVTVVSEYKTSPNAMHSQRNPEAYVDLKGMTGIKQDGTVDRSLQASELKGTVLNQKTVSYKGKEWYTDKAGRSLEKAAECEKAAQSLNGMAREAKLAEAQSYRCRSYSQKVEGVRQITKQTEQIIIPRDNYSVAMGGESTITAQMLDNHAMAKLVAEEKLPLVIFEKNLAQQGLTLESWGEMVSKCLH